MTQQEGKQKIGQITVRRKPKANTPKRETKKKPAYKNIY